MDQFDKLGFFFDLSRQFFTLDKECSKDIQETFNNLFERGILYRAKCIVN